MTKPKKKPMKNESHHRYEDVIKCCQESSRYVFLALHVYMHILNIFGNSFEVLDVYEYSRRG